MKINLSFRRVFPLAFFLMIFALGVRQSAFIDPDLWWHLQTGQDIVTSRAIPQTDIYSFTKAGSEWVTHEWLSEVLIYLTFQITGWAGLLVVFSTLVALAFYLVYRRCAGKPYVAAIAVLLAAVASSPLFGIRPQMLTLLLASIFITLLTQYGAGGPARRLYWMVPMMLLWVNLHAGYALGLGLLVLYGISFALDRKWNLIPRLGLILLACTAVVPLNPNGFRMFSYPLETLRSPSMAAFIEEWASPDFQGDVSPARSVSVPAAWRACIVAETRARERSLSRFCNRARSPEIRATHTNLRSDCGSSVCATALGNPDCSWLGRSFDCS